MKRCKMCGMVETKPGINLKGEGILRKYDGWCQACRHHDQRKDVDWKKRWEELKELCDKYRRSDGKPDCIVTVSGGKDSHFQLHILKEKLGMNPLLVSVSDPFTHTKAGQHNFQNIMDVFGCNTVALHMNPDMVRKIGRYAFETMLCPNWAIDQAIYAYPIKVAIEKNIPLIFYGENVSYEYGGTQNEETPSAMNQIYNNVVRPIKWETIMQEAKLSNKDIDILKYPSKNEIENARLNPQYLSYYVPWDGWKNYQIAKQYGFKTLAGEWQREGFVEDYDQIDSIAYLVHVWCKYPKFGFGRVTDVVGYWVRSNVISISEGLRLIEEEDHKLDRKVLDDFCRFFGYTHKEFWGIIDKFWNKDIFEKVDGYWRMKE